MKRSNRTYIKLALSVLCSVAAGGSLAQVQQVPGACNAPAISPQQGKPQDQAEHQARMQGYLLCLEEQQRNTRAIDEGLRRGSPSSPGRAGDSMDRRSGDGRDSGRR